MSNLTKIISKRTAPIWVLALLGIGLALIPFYGIGYSQIMLISIYMYIIITVSWAIFSGPTGYISLASAAFFGLGIYVTALLGNSLPILVVVVIAGLACFVLGFLVGIITLRLRGIYFSIFTFGLVELIKRVLVWYEVNFTGTRGRFVVVVDNDTIYFIMFGILVVLLLTAYFIRRSKWGLALSSIGEYEEASAHVGVNVTILKTVTFAISAIFMGAAGAIIATRWTYIDPYIAFNPLFSFMPVLMAVFGGLGQLYGPVIGALLFGYLEELLLTKFPYYYMLIFGLILLISIVFLPQGLVGLLQKWRKGGSEKTNVNP